MRGKSAKKKMNPLDEALGAKVKAAADRRAKDHELWQTWKAEPTQENMHALMQRFEPVFKQKTQQWKAPFVNEAAFNTNLQRNAINAFNTYDPDRGAALRTHLENHLKRTMRFNVQQQNAAYIPEVPANMIGKINTAVESLRDDLGRDPSHEEVARYMTESGIRITPKKIKSVQDRQFGDAVGDMYSTDSTTQASSVDREVLGLLRPTLTPDQQEVFDHLYKLNGKRSVTSTGQLAKILGKSPSQISQLRTSILRKFEQYRP